jgi:AcrR family transcriptional regulator
MNPSGQTASEPRRLRRDAAELRAAIIEAAAEVFFEQGYEGASIEAVIERVGGSKRAIYSHFGGKKELFAAIVTENASRALAALSPAEMRGRNLEDTLVLFGRRYLEILMTPATLALYRTIVAEGVRFPELSQVFFENGPGRSTVRLASVLDGFRERGEIDMKDTTRAAEHFIGMLRDDLHLKTVLGLRPPAGPVEIEASAQQATRIFLDGCRPKHAAKPGKARSSRQSRAGRKGA